MPPEIPHLNQAPDPAFTTIAGLRAAMTALNPDGAAYLGHLLEGPFTEGKGVWVNGSSAAKQAMGNILASQPELACENPYAEHFRRAIRRRGENTVILRGIHEAPAGHRAILDAPRGKPVALFAGGPAAKIAALLAALNGTHEVHFVLDGAEQSNESGSASYEHVNHANALNAEYDNTGHGIFFTALKRAIFGEPDPAVALSYDYRKVDLWPHALSWRDVPIYAGNELHGLAQSLKRLLGLDDDHAKSRRASLVSTHLMSWLEQRLGQPFRLDNSRKRAIFLFFTAAHVAHAARDNRELRAHVGLDPQALTAEKLEHFYGPGITARVAAGDLFPENACIRHGFDQVCRAAMEPLGIRYHHRRRIDGIYFDKGKATGVTLADPATGSITCLPLDHLGLSLGPTATYRYAQGTASPVPYQTIATGLSAQVLFRITDEAKSRDLPFTGLKQTHFVEIGRSKTHVLMKLTCGGVIGLPVYSRSYGISALASLLRVIGPGVGLMFEDVISAFPCTRGINAPNNGQVVRLAENAVARFAEGGTGMSKMASNAQTMLDLTGLAWPAPQDLRIDEALYRHTVIDRRSAVSRKLSRR
ncbi:hypothetical protein [Aestuariivirga sp.]|uniref:hypothetical protein n=1 Tax=Aestuariivirga sp. TaxID=2650926 RepID=UPI0039E3C902